MTPREYAREMDAARARSRHEHQRDLFLAWQTASFVGSAMVDKLPDFKSVMARLQWSDGAPVSLKGALLADERGIPIRPISEEAKAALMRLQARRG